MATTVSDSEMIAILAEMSGSAAPALSPIKSSKRSCDTESPEKIPEPAPKQQRTEQNEGIKTTRNRLTNLETRRAKCKRSLQVLREHAADCGGLWQIACSYGARSSCGTSFACIVFGLYCKHASL